MKLRLGIYLLLIGIPMQTDGQIKTYQLSLKDSTLNILNIGCENALSVKNLPKDCIVKFNDEVLEPLTYNSFDEYIKYGNYSVNPNDTGDNILRVLKKGKEVFQKKFIAKRHGDPTVKFGIVKDSFASVEQILAYPKLFVYTPNYYLKYGYSLVRYNIYFAKGTNTKSIYRGYIDGRPMNYDMAEFDDEIKNEIKLLKKGDRVFIDDIVILGDGGCTGCARSMPPIDIIIK